MASPPSDRDLPPPPSFPPPPPPSGESADAAKTAKTGKAGRPASREIPPPPLKPQAKGAVRDAAHLARRAPPPGAVKLPTVPEHVLRRAEKADTVSSTTHAEPAPATPKIGVGRAKPAAPKAPPRALGTSSESSSATAAAVPHAKPSAPGGKQPPVHRAKPAPPVPRRESQPFNYAEYQARTQASEAEGGETLHIQEQEGAAAGAEAAGKRGSKAAAEGRRSGQSDALKAAAAAGSQTATSELFGMSPDFLVNMAFLNEIKLEQIYKGKPVYEMALPAAYAIFTRNMYPRNLKEFGYISRNLDNIEAKLKELNPAEHKTFVALKDTYLSKALAEAKLESPFKIRPPFVPGPETTRWQLTANMLNMMFLQECGRLKIPPNNLDVSPQDHLANLGIIGRSEFLMAYPHLKISTEDLLDACHALIKANSNDPTYVLQVLNFVQAWLEYGWIKTEPTSVTAYDPIRDRLMLFWGESNLGKVSKQEGFKAIQERLRKTYNDQVKSSPLPITAKLPAKMKDLREIIRSRSHKEFAAELTTALLEMRANIPQSEWLMIAKAERSPVLQDCMRKQNALTHWISDQIVSAADGKEAKQIYHFFMLALKDCLYRGDLQGAFTIYKGLNVAPVENLGADIAYKDAAIDSLFHYGSNFKNLRQEQRSRLTQGMCLSCLELLGSDIDKAGENPETVQSPSDDSTRKLNIHRFNIVSKILRAFNEQSAQMLATLPQRERITDLMPAFQSVDTYGGIDAYAAAIKAKAKALKAKIDQG